MKFTNISISALSKSLSKINADLYEFDLITGSSSTADFVTNDHDREVWFELRVLYFDATTGSACDYKYDFDTWQELSAHVSAMLIAAKITKGQEV